MDPLMILVAGPYRSGTNDDPTLIARNVAVMTETSLRLFRAGHLPVRGEWFALPLLRTRALSGSGTRSSTRSSIRSRAGWWPSATPASVSAAR